MQRSSRVDYDAIAELYDSTPHREKSADPELIAFLAGCGPAASLTLLDIACGTGNQQIASLQGQVHWRNIRVLPVLS